MTKYSVKKFLNKVTNPSNGWVSLYYGPSSWDKDEIEMTASIGDCHQAIRLHKSKEDSVRDFTKKIRLLATELDKFATFLENLK